MKPQLYSIVILLLARINYVQNADNSTKVAAVTGTQLTPIPPRNTSVAKPPEDKVTFTTKAPEDHKTSAPETTENNITSVTKAPKGNTTSVPKTSRETVVSEIPTGNVTVLSEAPHGKATSAPSPAPNVSPVRTTKGFTMSDGILRSTGSNSISIGNQTSNPVVVGNATTQWSNEVTTAVRKTTRPTKTTTAKATGNRTSAFPMPSLFALMLLVSTLCF